MNRVLEKLLSILSVRRTALVGTFAAMLFGAVSPAGAQIDNLPVSRLQVRIKTCDITNAGSADRMYLYFGGHPYPFHAGFATGRNTSKAYDVLLPMIATSSNPLSTVGSLGGLIKIGKVGSDGWCINQVEVYLNGWGENGGSDSVDAQALIYRSPAVNQWLDSSSGNVLIRSWQLTTDTTNYVSRPYLTTVRNAFGLHAIQRLIAAGFNHLTSPAGFLYGRPYNGNPQWNPFPVNAPLGEPFGSSFFFNTGLRTMSNSGVLASSPHVIPIAVHSVVPSALFYAYGVPGSTEGTNAVQLTLSSMNTMLARVMGPHDPAQAAAIYTRFGGVGSNDFYVFFVP